MALKALSPDELACSPTVFSSFMGQPGASFRTVDELLGIYRERSTALSRADDQSEHLRVERFMHDMASAKWKDAVVMRIGVYDDTVLLIDGIHRAIAYLGCVEDGIAADRLPALHVDR
jgi:hypothetical protein